MGGDSLRNLRVAAGLSLWEVARPLGWTATYLSDIERGNRPENADRDAKIEATIRILAAAQIDALKSL